MRRLPLTRPLPPIHRALCFKKNRLEVALFFVALVLCTTAPGSAQGTLPIQVEAGWNLLSLPVKASGEIDSLFPFATSPAYTWGQGVGYVASDTIGFGVGFWMRFASPHTVQISGEKPITDTIDVVGGWNILGSLSEPVPVSFIRTVPPGSITAGPYAFFPGEGYLPIDTLFPGRGHWFRFPRLIDMKVILSICPDTVAYAGKTYHVVQIGSQCWLKENLDVGSMIPSSQDQANNELIEKYCYGNSLTNCNTYGGLYQWSEAMQFAVRPGARGICPPGWHFPTYSEFDTLTAQVNDDGNALKEIGQGWGLGAGTNTSHFSALLAGYSNPDGNFADQLRWTFFWSSSGGSLPENASAIGLVDSVPNIYPRNDLQKDKGFSVRCIFGEPDSIPPPWNPDPHDGMVNASTSPTLRWSVGGVEKDLLTFDVYFGTTNPPDSIVSSNQTDTALVRTGLATGTTYYWKVVVKDDHGHSTAGPVWNFTTYVGGGSPCPGTPTVLYAGKLYNTVQIGSQCWLRENLDVGTMIPGSENEADNGIIEKYCYNDSAANCYTYGGLYQWSETVAHDSGPGPRTGICPPGWHIPTLAEFEALDSSVVDGNALKQIGQGSGGGAGTNTSGFSAMFSGYRFHTGEFRDLGAHTYIWSSTVALTTSSYYLNLYYSTNGIQLYETSHQFGFSVRCLKE